MYLRTNFLLPQVVFTNPYTPSVNYGHQIAGDAAAATLAPLGNAAHQTALGVDPAATTIDAHATLNHLAGDGFNAAAADQERLSVEDQLAQDGVINGNVQKGQELSNQTIGTPPVGNPVAWPPAPEPPVDIPGVS